MNIWSFANRHPWKTFVVVIVLAHYGAQAAKALAFAALASMAGGAL